MFYVGQKVVCVRADSEFRPQYLKEGSIYTVSGFNGPGGLVLAEVNLHEPWGGFRKSRFRPVVERKTDISIFTDMLTPKTEQVSA